MAGVLYTVYLITRRTTKRSWKLWHSKHHRYRGVAIVQVTCGHKTCGTKFDAPLSSFRLARETMLNGLSSESALESKIRCGRVACPHTYSTPIAQRSVHQHMQPTMILMRAPQPCSHAIAGPYFNKKQRTEAATTRREHTGCSGSAVHRQCDRCPCRSAGQYLFSVPRIQFVHRVADFSVVQRMQVSAAQCVQKTV